MPHAGSAEQRRYVREMFSSIAPTYEEVRDSMLEILDRPNVRAVMRENQVVDSGYTSTITSGSSNPPDNGVRFPRKEEEE